MSPKGWYIEAGQISSTFPILIPWLNGRVDKVWFEVEVEQEWWTVQQYNAYRQFIELPESTQKQVERVFTTLYHQKLSENIIEETNFENILDTIHWEESHFCIPYHLQSKNHYIFFLPQMKWKLNDSDYGLEALLLFRNGKIILTQEFSDIWMWPDWFDYVDLGGLEF